MLARLVISLLRDLATRIENGSCAMSDEELMTALQVLELYDSSALLSKDQMCTMLDMSRSSFDERVRNGVIPKGRKVPGFKELFWKKSDIINYLKFKEELENMNKGLSE